MGTQSNSAIKIVRMIISGAFFLGIFVSVICDVAITGGLSWSLYPVVSILFTWLVILPIFYLPKYRILFSLVMCSVLIIPYLMSLDRIIGDATYFLSLGIPMAIIMMVYVWAVFFLFSSKRIGIWYSLAGTMLLCIPVSLGVDYVIYAVLDEPVMQIWDALSYIGVACLSVLLFVIGKRKTNYAS